jgi:hypothetical protein
MNGRLQRCLVGCDIIVIIIAQFKFTARKSSRSLRRGETLQHCDPVCSRRLEPATSKCIGSLISGAVEHFCSHSGRSAHWLDRMRFVVCLLKANVAVFFGDTGNGIYGQ